MDESRSRGAFGECVDHAEAVEERVRASCRRECAKDLAESERSMVRPRSEGAGNVYVGHGWYTLRTPQKSAGRAAGGRQGADGGEADLVRIGPVDARDFHPRRD